MSNSHAFFLLCSFQNIHNAAIKVVSVTASLLQYACLSVVSLFVCLSLSSALVVGGPGRPSLLKEHKGDCCGSSCSGVQRLSVFVFVSVCVCALSPGRAGQTGPVHMEPAPLVSFVVALGIFPIGAWSVQYHAASSSSRKAVFPSLFCLSFIFLRSHSSLSPLFITLLFCLPNLFHFSLSCSVSTPSPWPHRPFLSACIHHLSDCIWFAFVHKSL